MTCSFLLLDSPVFLLKRMNKNIIYKILALKYLENSGLKSFTDYDAKFMKLKLILLYRNVEQSF